MYQERQNRAQPNRKDRRVFDDAKYHLQKLPLGHEPASQSYRGCEGQDQPRAQSLLPGNVPLKS